MSVVRTRVPEQMTATKTVRVHEVDPVRTLLTTRTRAVPAAESARLKHELDTAQRANRDVSGPLPRRAKKRS